MLLSLHSSSIGEWRISNNTSSPPSSNTPANAVLMLIFHHGSIEASAPHHVLHFIKHFSECCAMRDASSKINILLEFIKHINNAVLSSMLHQDESKPKQVLHKPRHPCLTAGLFQSSEWIYLSLALHYSGDGWRGFGGGGRVMDVRRMMVWNGAKQMFRKVGDSCKNWLM